MVRRLLQRDYGFPAMSGKGELWLMVVIAVLIVLSFVVCSTMKSANIEKGTFGLAEPRRVTLVALLFSPGA